MTVWRGAYRAPLNPLEHVFCHQPKGTLAYWASHNLHCMDYLVPAFPGMSLVELFVRTAPHDAMLSVVLVRRQIPPVRDGMVIVRRAILLCRFCSHSAPGRYAQRRNRWSAWDSLMSFRTNQLLIRSAI